VDQERRLITIAAGFDLETWKPYTKTRKNRTIPYNQTVQDCLDRQPRSLTGFIFVNSKGKHLSHRRLDTVWLQAARSCGLEINLYQATRHSFATQKNAADFSRDKVGQMMGHLTPTKTLALPTLA
jgi:site-specific recombinase XerD